MRAYLDAGVEPSNVITSPADWSSARHDPQKFIAATDVAALDAIPLDVVYEATGDITLGTQVALGTIERGIHFVTGCCEMDAAIGLVLARLAKAKGVVYSNSDGDQPTCLARMIMQVTDWGFEPKVVGNCKGFIDLHQDPTGVQPFVPTHQNPANVCAMADGSKQADEMVCLGNVFGYYPAKRGMHGPVTTKSELVATFDKLLDLASYPGTCLDFVLGVEGVDQGGGVFVVAHRDDLHTRRDMKFLKKGDGPLYLFFRDHHLCYFEAADSIADAVLLNLPTSAPTGRFVDVMSVAKRDLEAGQELGPVGGYNHYGLVERADVVAQENILPHGLAKFATANRPIAQDTPITYDDVDMADNVVIELRRQLEALPLGVGSQ